MSILECRLAANKPMDGKPFTVCELDTWDVISIIASLNGNFPALQRTMLREIYDQFNGDTNERGVTLDELMSMKSNGGMYIVTELGHLVCPVDWNEYQKRELSGH